jgi:hypothetical protein
VSAIESKLYELHLVPYKIKYFRNVTMKYPWRRKSFTGYTPFHHHPPPLS